MVFIATWALKEIGIIVIIENRKLRSLPMLGSSSRDPPSPSPGCVPKWLYAAKAAMGYQCGPEKGGGRSLFG